MLKRTRQTKEKENVTRRGFLKAAAAAAGAATLGFPMIAKAQGPISNALAEHLADQGQFSMSTRSTSAKLVNDMTGGDLEDRSASGGRRRAGLGLLALRLPRGRSTAATGCWATTTASRMRWRCGTPARASAWTPT